MARGSIFVAGAAGRTGARLVEQATARGYRVRALIRKQEAEFPFPGSVEIVKGDILRPETYAEKLAGSKAVVSVIGHVRSMPQNVQAQGIESLIQAMQKQRVNRLISLTGTGVRMPGDKPSLVDRLLNIGLRVIDPARLSDGIAHAQIIAAHNKIDWTIIRVLKLTNGEQVNDCKLTPGGPAKMLVSRADVAHAILEVIESNAWQRQAPVLSKR